MWKYSYWLTGVLYWWLLSQMLTHSVREKWIMLECQKSKHAFLSQTAGKIVYLNARIKIFFYPGEDPRTFSKVWLYPDSYMSPPLSKSNHMPLITDKRDRHIVSHSDRLVPPWSGSLCSGLQMVASLVGGFKVIALQYILLVLVCELLQLLCWDVWLDPAMSGTMLYQVDNN